MVTGLRAKLVLNHIPTPIYGWKILSLILWQSICYKV